MPYTIGNTTISRVLIVDDDKDGRTAFGFALEELGIEPIFQEASLPDNIDVAVATLRKMGDALVSDYHLRKKGNYAHFDGDALVATANAQHFPALLCTNYTDSALTLSRSFRRHIPAFLTNEDYTPRAFVAALDECLRENNGVFHTTRKPWRSLVRVEDVINDGGYFYAVVPGWSPDQKLRINIDDIPGLLRKTLKAGDRLHAKVNIGAKKPEDLFFDEWETK